MSVVIEEPQPRAVSQYIVNDFNINVATANGSGSQTSNNMLIRSLYKMGIPVTGKNLFPSNIQGLPTWYNIRLSKDGFLARRERVEIMICMNGATVAEDMESVVDGGIILYDDSLPIANHRKDVQYFPMPVRELVKGANLPFNLQKYVANMVYVGVVAYLLEIDMDEIKDALAWNFGGKTKPIELNWGMVSRAYDWAKANLVNDQPYRVERMTGFNEGTLLVDGNTAAGIGALFGGMTFSAWYPITPSTSLVEAMNTYAAQLRRDPETGKATYAIVQAEDELAASGMIMGAGWAGRTCHDRHQRPRHQPHVRVRRLWLLRRDSRRHLGHSAHGPEHRSAHTHQPGRHPGRLLPEPRRRHATQSSSRRDPNECFEMAGTAFDVAERLQTPVFVLSDLDIGMNLWITKEFQYPEKPLDRGKVLSRRRAGQVQG